MRTASEQRKQSSYRWVEDTSLVDWTSDKLCEFVDGRRMGLRDVAARLVEPPEWLASFAASVELVGSEEFATSMHLKDRVEIGRFLYELARHPGRVGEITVRSELEGSWHALTLHMVYLRDHADVPGFLSIIVEDVPIEDVEEPETVESVESPPWCIMHVDASMRVMRVDGMVEELFGRPAAAVQGRHFLKWVHSQDQTSAYAVVLEVNKVPDVPRTVALRVVRPDRSKVWVELTLMNQLDREAPVVVAVFHDVTERRAREAALRAREAEFRMLAEEVPSAFFRVDPSGRVTYGNARWHELMAPCGTVECLQEVVHPDDRPQVDAMLRALFLTGDAGSRTIEVCSAEGARTFSVTCRVAGEAEPGATDTDARAVIGAITDVTATAELRHLAEYDLLTGTLNRHAFERHLEHAIAADPDGVLVMFIDLDGFKSVNDDHSHDAGDVVLREVAKRLRNALRPADEIGRYGGDEFIVVCHDATPAAEHALADRIRAVLRPAIEWDGGSWMPAASIGMARPAPGEDGAAVVHRADRAMYQDKRARRPRSTGGTDRAEPFDVRY